LTGWRTHLNPDVVASNPSFVLLLLLKSWTKLSKVHPPSLFTTCTSFMIFSYSAWMEYKFWPLLRDLQLCALSGSSPSDYSQERKGVMDEGLD